MTVQSIDFYCRQWFPWWGRSDLPPWEELYVHSLAMRVCVCISAGLTEESKRLAGQVGFIHSRTSPDGCNLEFYYEIPRRCERSWEEALAFIRSKGVILPCELDLDEDIDEEGYYFR